MTSKGAVLLPTQQQLEEIEQHRLADAREGSQQLTPQQQEQLDRDLERLGVKDMPKEVHLQQEKPVDRFNPIVPLPELEVQKFEPITSDHATSALVDPRLVASGWRYRAFPMGGWVWHDKPAWMQRTDQGQDFEIVWGTHIVAPGWGHVVSWLHDGPFPNGFGSPYMVVYIGSGRFMGRLWYLGHMNYCQVRPGESFHAGRALGRLYNSLNSGRGWIEVGHAANGYPMAMGEGAKWHYLFTSPEWRWSY